jgi:hypothetical protein
MQSFVLNFASLQSVADTDQQYRHRSALRTVFFLFLWHNSPNRAWATSLLRFLDHTHTHTLRRTPLDERSARRQGHCVHNKHNRRTSTPSAEFETITPAIVGLQTSALHRTAIEIGLRAIMCLKFIHIALLLITVLSNRICTITTHSFGHTYKYKYININKYIYIYQYFFHNSDIFRLTMWPSLRRHIRCTLEIS